MTKTVLPSVCPHDCPSACALDVEMDAPDRVGRVRGADQPYTAGVICAKVGRYAEVVHSDQRILTPLRRVGAKGEGRFEPISWDQALDITAEAFRKTAAEHGPEAVWGYFYAGTLSRVQQTAMPRLRDALGWSRQLDTICSHIGGTGWKAGVGPMSGVDPREMAESDLIVAWGCNMAHTQVGAMHWVTRAKKERGAKFVVVDPYRNATAEKADIHLKLLPGSDAALACAVMNVLLAEGYADREYLSQYSDFGPDVEAHLATRTPAWAAPITGLSEDEIIAFARLFGSTKRAFVRLGYGFTRQRNGAAAMHAATCLPTMTGAWKHPGGGAAASAWRNFAFLREDLLESPGSTARILDMSRIGPVLCGDPRDLGDGPPIKAMLIQNTNPAVVAPDSLSVRKGLSRQDLFLAVHEQRMTETARYADIVFPATTMLEHDDFYISYGHTFLQAAKAVMKPVGEARSNHWLTSELAKRLGASQPMFGKPDWQVVDEVLKASGLAGADDLAAKRWIDCARPFEQMHFLEGFAHSDKRFHFKPDWAALGDEQGRMPRMPDYLDINDVLDEERNFRLVTAPSRHFLNTSFSNAASSRKAAERPTVLLHPENLDELGFAEGELIRIGNRQAETRVWVKRSDTVRRGVVVVEGVWPSEDFPGGVGINALTSAEPAWPAGGAVFHDTTVWLRKLGKEEQA